MDQRFWSIDLSSLKIICIFSVSDSDLMSDDLLIGNINWHIDIFCLCSRNKYIIRKFDFNYGLAIIRDFRNK